MTKPRRNLSDSDLLAAIADGEADEQDLLAVAARRGLVPPGVDTQWDSVRDIARRRMSHFGVPDEALASLAPCALIHVDSSGSSRLGGQPRLPSGLPWPHREGRPLHHIVQLDLATAPPVLARLGLPRAGLLTYFHDLDLHRAGAGGWGAWPADLGSGVLMLVQETHAEPAAWPQGIAAEQRNPGVTATLALAADVESVKATFGLGPGRVRVSDDVANGLDDHMRTETEHPHGAHKLLGVATDVQGPPLQTFPSADRAGPPPAGHDDLRARNADDWRLLLQVEAQVGSALDYDRGDFGVVFVGIQHADLAAEQFTRAWTTIVGT